MVTDSLPAIPSVERIHADAAQIADGIRQHLTSIEREPIVAYGRCLLNGTEPTNGQIVRFAAALRKSVPYLLAAGRLSTDLTALRSFQDEIARLIAGGVH